MDIYGFEVFDINTFDQLAINYANEKLQEIFINNVLKAEEKIYVEEGIPFTKLEYEDNSEVLSLIEAKPFGIMYSIFDEINFPESSDDRLLTKLFTVHKNSKLFGWVLKSKTKFTLSHFNSQVEYEITGFIAKN